MPIQKISVDSYSPLFSLPIVQGGEFELGKSLLSGPVVINFIRGTWCEFCMDHILKVKKWKSQRLESKGIKSTVVVISSEPREQIVEYLSTHPMPFLFLQDTNGKIARLYEFQNAEDAYSRPAMVLIDSNRRIRLIDDGFKGSKSLQKTGEICEDCQVPPKSA